MSNSQITSQLTRVTVPSISDGKFAEGIGRAFETINNNFKTIASLPFIQGVQGDSYTLISKDIWVEVNNNISPVYYALTKEGAVLLNSIFKSFLDKYNIGDTDTKKFHEGDSFDECKTNILGELSLNGVSPIDSFFTEEDGNVEPVNNKLYFYSVINNLNEEQDTYLGQYFYFIDYRITELGNAYQNENLSDFIDYTGFYQYQPESEIEIEKYIAISIVPNLYYDKDKDDICWKYNGQETGISAIGPKGLDGKDANFKIVYVQYVNDTDNSGKILGYFDSVTKTIKYTSTLENCFCLVQIVNTTTNEDNEVTVTSYVDSAFGEVHDGKAYWENSLKIGNLFNNQNITKYFCSMGNYESGIENHPYYLAIPANLDRTNANDDSYKVGHVFSSSANGNLILQKADNAFTENAGQTGGKLISNELENEFDIQNYNVKIGKNLNVSGTLGVKEKATFSNDLIVSGTLGVTGTATFSNDLIVSGTLGVTGTATFSNDVYVSGTLGVHGHATIVNLEVPGDASVSGNLEIKNNTTSETLDVIGSASIGNLDVPGIATIGNLDVNNNVSISGTLDVSDGASIGGNLDVTGGATITGGSFIVNINDTDSFSIKTSGYGISCDDQGTMNINTSDLTIDGGVSVSNSLNVTGGATINNELNVSGGLQVTTKKANNIDVENGTADGKSNVLFGHNNPGNTVNNPDIPDEDEKSDDFPLNIEGAGYPLVIKSTNSDGNTDPGYMIFGPGDIYAVKKDVVNGKDVIVPSTLYLQDRSNYYGDVLIGRNLQIGKYSGDSGGTGGNLIINGPNGTSGLSSSALIIRKPSVDGKKLVDKLTIFSNGNIVTAGSVEIQNGATITGDTFSINTTNMVVSSSKLTINNPVEITNTSPYALKTPAATITDDLYIGKKLTVYGADKDVDNNSIFHTGETSVSFKNSSYSTTVHIETSSNSNKNDAGLKVTVKDKNEQPAKAVHIIGGNNIDTVGASGTGGIGIDVCGGDCNQYGGYGGIGAVVKGGNGPILDSGRGGTGLYVEGGGGMTGGAGIKVKGGTGTSNGNAIVAYGNISVGDIKGLNNTSISSGKDGLNINNHTIITGGATINSGATINGGFVLEHYQYEISNSSNFKHIIPSNGNIYNLSAATGTLDLTTKTSFPVGSILILHGRWDSGSLTVKCGSVNGNERNYTLSGLDACQIFVKIDPDYWRWVTQ